MTTLEASKILGSDPTYISLLLRTEKLAGNKDVDGNWQIDTASVTAYAAKRAARNGQK
jgi:hypothetical protein